LVVGPAVEGCRPDTVVGDPVAIRLRNAFDETAQAEAPKVIGHGTGREVAPEEFAQLGTQVPVGEAAREKAEPDTRMAQSVR
jgi:hypothetical protein